jgi:hypothetical protein
MAIAGVYHPQPKKLGHLMLDLETMGSSSNSAIVSIGAVEFDIETGHFGREFYERVDLQSCIDKGLIVNGATIIWWLQQNEKARLELSRPAEDIMAVLMKLRVFMKEMGDFQIWGNGARFDIGILEDAYKACGYTETPWNFRMERDVRTLVSFAPKIKEHYPFTGVEHHPIDDCKYQIGYCSAIWNNLNKD